MIEAGADAFVIGEARYGMRLPGELKLDEIAEAGQAWHMPKASENVAVNNNVIDNEYG